MTWFGRRRADYKGKRMSGDMVREEGADYQGKRMSGDLVREEEG